MPYPIANFQILTPEQANPLGYGMMQGSKLMQSFSDTLAQELANQKARAQLPYAGPQAAANLNISQNTIDQYNRTKQYLGPQAEANLMKDKLANEYLQRTMESNVSTAGNTAREKQIEADQYAQQLAAQNQLRMAQAAQAQSNAQKLALALQGINGTPAQMSVPGMPQPASNTSNSNNIPTVINTQNNNASQSLANASTSAEQNQINSVPQNQQPSQDQIGDYGIQIQTPTPYDNYQQAVFGRNTFAPRQALYQQQILEQAKLQKDSATQAANDFEKTTKSVNNFDRFENYYNQSKYKGPTWGKVPLSIAGFGDRSNEQLADQAAANEMLQSMADVRSAMEKGAFSKVDVGIAESKKFNRSLDPQAVKDTGQQLRAIRDRSGSVEKYWALMNNPKTRLTNAQSKAMLSQYQNDFPVFTKDQDGKISINHRNNKLWAYYTTPEAINTFRKTGAYKPSEYLIKNTVMLVAPNGNMMPVKKDKAIVAIRDFGYKEP